MEKRLLNGEHHSRTPRKGLSVFTTTLFLVGEVAGSGVLSFPWALSRTGWIGFALLVTFAGVATYAAVLIGRCWLIISERFVEYRDQPVRHPYPLIGQLSFGKPCRQLISFCIHTASCGGCVAFLLMVSQNLLALFPKAGLGYGHWVVIVAAVLCPFCWFGTPKDFWLIALFATFTTSAASIMICVQIIKDSSTLPPAFYASVEPKSFLMSFGILCFGFGGHQTFPTIQVDMKKQERFGWAAAIGFLTILCVYIPITIASFMVYGSNVRDNVLLSLSQGPVNYTAMILMCVHLMASFVILLNPVSQELEDFLKAPNYFCFQRVLIRSALVGLILFVAVSLPQFKDILALVGGSLVTLIVFIIPPTCYLKLCSITGDWKTVEVPLHEKVMCVELIVVGVLAGLAATYSALDALTYSHFSKPLYLS